MELVPIVALAVEAVELGKRRTMLIYKLFNIIKLMIVCILAVAEID